MADVLIVCVREDEARAKSIADMFERAGFTVGGAPSSDAALRSCGATVVMWSQAAIRSRPFLDASQRAVNAGKAVLACLIDPPPADSVGGAPSFDLANWSGESDDPCLDSLFFAVDRMVAGNHVKTGAAAPRSAYEVPPARERERATRPAAAPAPYARGGYEPPAPSRAPSAPPNSSYQMRARQKTAPRPGFDDELPDRPYNEDRRTAGRANDDWGAEAEHWRSIRHSRDPADFLDFLSQFGPDSAFSELAEIRLKELQSRQPAVSRAATRETPSAPAPRRAEPAFEAPRPAARAPDRERTRERERELDRALPASLERERDRTPPPARVSSGGGGFARTFMVIVLLGGAALGGGLYFGLKQQAPSDVTASTDNAAPAAQASAAPAQTQQDAVSYEEAALDPPPAIDPSRTAPRGGPDLPRTPAARATPRAQTPNEERDLNAAAVSGPVPLAPTPSVYIAPTPTASVEAPPAPQLAETPRLAGHVSFAAQPSPQRIAALYPSRAERAGQTGAARLDCTVRPDFGLSCTIANETPQGVGFGAAALSAAGFFRVNPQLSDGSSAVGARSSVTIRFQGP